jgi:hypothetical protein
MRRLIHLAALLIIVAVVRACGGAVQAEDHLNFAARWVAEKAGLSSAKNTFDARVRPPIAAATSSVSSGIYAGVSRTMDHIDQATNSVTAWLGQQLDDAKAAVKRSFQSLVTPNAETQKKRDAQALDKEHPPLTR